MMVHDYFLNENREMDEEDLVIYNVGFGDSFPGYTYGYDSRNYYLLQYTLRGLGHLELNGNIFDVGDDQGFITPPQTTFRITNETEWNLCWIGFNGPHIASHLEGAGLLGDSPVFSFHDHALLESIIEDIYFKARNPMISNATLIGLLYSLLGHLAERDSTPPRPCQTASCFPILKRPTISSQKTSSKSPLWSSSFFNMM